MLIDAFSWLNILTIYYNMLLEYKILIMAGSMLGSESVYTKVCHNVTAEFRGYVREGSTYRV
jgi:hypothetical protein